MITALRIWIGWYRYRKAEGHPITMWRALFSAYPRFGPYEEGEAGFKG